MKDRIIPSTMIFRTLPLKKALEHIRNAGYEKAELCVVPGWVDHYDVRNATPEKLAEAISTVAASGVRIVAVNFGLSWLDEAGNIDYDMDRIARNALNLTSALGAKVMTFAAGRIPPDGKRQNWLKKIAGRNAELADLAAARGVALSIEAPHKRSIAEQPEDIAAYWADQIDSIKVTLDPAHMTYAGANAAEIAGRLAYRCAHAHLRDAVKGNSLLQYGEGCVDFRAYISAIVQGGYTGDFSMEFPTESEEEGVARLNHAKDFFAKLYSEAEGGC